MRGFRIAAGSVVCPIGGYAAAARRRRDVAFVPITDGPTLQFALVWRGAGETQLVRAFAQAAVDARNAA